jgi:excisionase family DNA binding protein
MTVEQLAELLQLSAKTLYRALERGELRGSKLGNRWRIRVGDAERWFDENVPERVVSRVRRDGRRSESRPAPEGSLRPLLMSDREGVG